MLVLVGHGVLVVMEEEVGQGVEVETDLLLIGGKGGGGGGFPFT